MAFENFPEAERSYQELSRRPDETKSNIRGIMTVALIILLLGTWGYIIWDKNNVKETLQQKETVIASTSNQRDELQKDLEDATMRYDMLKTSNSKKDSAISAKDRDIEEKQTRIRALLTKVNATTAELIEARGLISSLNGDIEGYKTTIETLQGQKIQLTQEKVIVTQQRDKIQKDLDSTSVVVKEKESVIDIGSTLHASNFNIIGVNERSNGKEKVTTTAKKVDKLRISFDLDENMITQSGQKEIYIIITGPDGKPILLDEQGPAKFNTREGEQKVYTYKLDVNYTQNKRQTISFDWKAQNADFETGEYKIEVYNNGFKVGEGSKPLKKGGLFS